MKGRNKYSTFNGDSVFLACALLLIASVSRLLLPLNSLLPITKTKFNSDLVGDNGALKNQSPVSVLDPGAKSSAFQARPELNSILLYLDAK